MTASKGPAPWRGQALLFDLFGTVVQFAPQVPTIEVAGTAWRSTMGWLRAAAERELPEVPFDDVLPALMRVTEEIVRERPPDYREVPSRERFRRALVRLGVEAGHAATTAESLSLAHMDHLASMTVLPADHVALLEKLAARYRLGLVSNFDHAPTARSILATHGVAQFFSSIVISDEFGRRKPHAAIFEAAMRGVGVDAAAALFIGDSVGDDVVGAHNAGLPVVWLNRKDSPVPADGPAPDYTIARLADLPAIVST